MIRSTTPSRKSTPTWEHSSRRWSPTWNRASNRGTSCRKSSGSNWTMGRNATRKRCVLEVKAEVFFYSATLKKRTSMSLCITAATYRKCYSFAIPIYFALSNVWDFDLAVCFRSSAFWSLLSPFAISLYHGDSIPWFYSCMRMRPPQAPLLCD